MSPTRRRALQGAIPVLLGIAGCLQVNSESNGADNLDRDGTGTVSDPPIRKPRNPDGDRVLVHPDMAGTKLLLSEGRQADELAFEPGVPQAARDSALEFITATDFSSETIFITHSRIESCYQLRIKSLSWSPGRIEYEYCRGLRPADVRCSADATETVALVFRLPESIQMEITSFGSSGRSPCRNHDVDWATIDANSSERS